MLDDLVSTYGEPVFVKVPKPIFSVA